MGQQISINIPEEGSGDIGNEIDLQDEMREPIPDGNTEATLDLNTPELPVEMELPKEEEVIPINPQKLVENAIKHKKVFAITGGHTSVRHSLRRRGWVEKFFNVPLSMKKTPMVAGQKYAGDLSEVLHGDDDNCDDDFCDDKNDDIDNDQPKIPPWEEGGGIYGEMSRMLHNVNPTLFWVLRRDTNDYSFLTRRQMVNHYSNVACFTTKAGLCTNLKNVMWFTNVDADSFFPRCYLLSNDDEKKAFIDDFRITACMNIVKEAVHQHYSSMQPGMRPGSVTESCDSQQQGSNVDACSVASSDAIHRSPDRELPSQLEKSPLPENVTPATLKTKKKKKRKKKQPVVPTHVLEIAVVQCEKLLAGKTHEDLDTPANIGVLTEEEWDDLIKWSYQLIQEEGHFYSIPIHVMAQCESLLERLPKYFPQFEMSGTRNVWIAKPGAKSRGRGIKCYEKLNDILPLVSSLAAKIEGKYVVQKYIEHPLLIYNTKFDIRQWFLVTDWNPLTVWFYKDSYLRFCSQQFTLEDFSESIHLSNNAIQKHYKNGPRSPQLPQENMWTSQDFRMYLEQNEQGAAWATKIYPLMKQAVICALLVSQDMVEGRKSSFELYGADFMLTEDLTPWLLEINASPSMESSTTVTARMCKAVLEDTIKVVIDRKFHRNCDTGRFELVYKQPYISARSYTGISLCVLGQAITKPSLKESCGQKKCGGNNGPLNLHSFPAQQSDNITCDSKQSGNFSMLGVKDIINNILFYNGNQTKSNTTRSSYESASPHHFLYTIPRSLKHANSAAPIVRKSVHNKTAAVKTKNGKVSQSHKPGSRSKSRAKKSESVHLGSCQQCGQQHTFHLLSRNPNCQCQKCSFVLTLPRNQLNTAAHNLAKCNSQRGNRKQIQYSTNCSPDGKAQKALSTIASCVTCLRDNAAALLFDSLPQETVDVTSARPASARCVSENSSVPPSPRPRYQKIKTTCSQLCYQNPSEFSSLTQKQQCCNGGFGNNCGTFTAVQKNRTSSQNLLYRTFTPDVTGMRRADA